MKQSKACLVTGGAGFIGSHLCQELLTQGQTVFAIDNLITGSRSNISRLEPNSRFHFIQHDVTRPINLTVIPDYIFHLASPASVPDYQKFPKETALVNSAGTMIMLDLAQKSSARFLYTSTSEVYGNPGEHPQKETYWGHVNPTGIRACYDESKRYGEMMTMLYHRTYGADIRIVRIFNTYGPRMRPDDGRVVSNFVNQALSGKPLTVYGNGSQTRSFCYVDDMIRGILSAMFSDGTNGEVFNLGNPQEISVMDLALMVIRATGSKSRILNKPLPEDDPEIRCPDISKAKSKFGWQPEIQLDTGLTKTISYYRDLQSL